ncbi:MAG: UDP-N-acetylmuramoyl-L-alanine--D-glutamate ligase [Flexilinea sp.]|nr:UDP-N-acetylmuramoyl-L-alanine--D-glutamate ligase [Flexilinea sp.]
MIDFKDKTVVVLGAARQGLALAKYAAAHGAHVIITDKRTYDQLEAARDSVADITPEWVCGEHPLSLLDRADILCVTAGADLRIPFLRTAMERGIPVYNDATIFLHEVKNPIIAITGSSGKTTTTTLVGRMAKAAARPGQNVWVGGNIGYALMSFIDEIQSDDLVVLELSSFQLELVKDSPHVAAILNITPNHLDRHETMENYTAAKVNILRYQEPDDTAVLFRENEITWQQREILKGGLVSFGFEEPEAEQARAVYLKDDKIIYRENGKETVIMGKDLILLRGRHNICNVMAACAIAAAASFPVEAMREGVQGFTGVPHRLQWVRKYRGADWYNDSIATAPERTMAALHSFHEPLVLLLGGRDKKLPWGELAEELQTRAHCVVLFGEAAGLIENALKQVQKPDGPKVIRCELLEDAVKAAAENCREGDVVLLSPGGTSYDAFVNFEERGDRFTEWVKALE